MKINKLLSCCFLIAIATSPVSALTLPMILIPAGHWESEEKLTIHFNYPWNGVSGDFGFTEGQTCQGFYLISERQRYSTGPTSPNNFSSIDAFGPNQESTGYHVKWTWIPPIQNPDLAPVPFTVLDSASAYVSVLDGSSPVDNNSGAVAGATATITGIVSAAAMTYGHGIGTYFNPPTANTNATETVTISGQKTCKTNGHTVAFVTGPSQHFYAYSQMSWTTN